MLINRLEKIGAAQKITDRWDRLLKATKADEKSSKNPEKSMSAAEKGSVTVSAVIFAAGTMVSRVLGLVRDIMTARYFSVEVRDAFIIAFRLPNLFRRLLGEGSLSISFIPVFVDLLQHKRKEEAHRLVNNVFAILLVITTTLSLLGIVFMDDILRLLLSGHEYMKIAGKFEITVRLARIMFAFLTLVSLFAFFMAILNSLRQFALSALAPALLNVAMIAGAMVSDRWLAPEEILAWAVMVGGFFQMAILIPPVLKAGFLPRFGTQWASPEVLRVLKAIIPSMLGMSIMQFTQIANIHFASWLEQGTHSAFYLADRILELPLSIFVVSVGSALLPTLARLWASNDSEAMAETINHYIRLILFVALPAAVGMFVLAQPITDVLFFGNRFSVADSIKTAQVIQIYAFGLVVSAGVRILAQGFYAIGNTWFPAVAATVAFVSHLVFAMTLTKIFGLMGLASATICSATVNLMMLVVAYHSWVGHLNLKKLAISFGKFVIGAAVMVVVLRGYGPLLNALTGVRFARTFSLLITIFCGGLSYMLVAHVLRVPEYHETVATFSTRIRVRLGRLRGRKS